MVEGTRRSPIVVQTKEELHRESVIENLSVEDRPPVLIPTITSPIGRVFNNEIAGYYAYVPPLGSTLRDRLKGPHGGIKEFISPDGATTGFAKPIKLTVEEGEAVLIRRGIALRKGPGALEETPVRKWASNIPGARRYLGFGSPGPW